MRKILEINEGGYHFRAYDDGGQMNPYRLYKVWYNCGWHREQIARYHEFESVMWHIHHIICLKGEI